MTQGEMFSDLALEQQYDNMIKALDMKQETLEEVAERILDRNEVADGDMILSCTFPNTIKSMVEMAKWQQEQMYSEEDMAESFMACWKANVPEGFECKISFKEWFEQFKKK